jgi:hypothetical protein
MNRTRLLTGGLTLAALLLACSPAAPVNLSSRLVGEVVEAGFAKGGKGWDLSGNRYWRAAVERHGIVIENTPVGTGVSPVWHEGTLPRDFEVAVRASVEKEGLDGGWGIEFGAQEKKRAYRVLVYASGRFCVDRFFDLYPEFIHCIPHQPQVSTGTATNEISVRVAGDRITVKVNWETVLEFNDERYRKGQLALAVAGAGTRVSFEDVAIVSSK